MSNTQGWRSPKKLIVFFVKYVNDGVLLLCAATTAAATTGALWGKLSDGFAHDIQNAKGKNDRQNDGFNQLMIHQTNIPPIVMMPKAKIQASDMENPTENPAHFQLPVSRRMTAMVARQGT